LGRWRRSGRWGQGRCPCGFRGWTGGGRTSCSRIRGWIGSGHLGINRPINRPLGWIRAHSSEGTNNVFLLIAAVEHALPDDNAICIRDKEVTFIVQLHTVGPLTKGKVPPSSLKIVVFYKIKRTRGTADINC
jgi:hypothetical protein